jgi:hypothetical protein
VPTQSVSIRLLLAGDMGRPVTHYVAGQLLGTLMRHVLAPVSVVLRPRRVVEPARARPLMALAGLALLLAAGHGGAGTSAVPLPPVTPPADEEHLPAGGPVAHHEAQRVHGSGRGRQELDVDPDPCDERLVDAGSGRTA